MTHAFLDHVETVLGPVPLGDLGVTLMHEHILNDCRCWWRGRDPEFRSPIRDLPVSAAIQSRLRHDPFANRDNCALDDEEMAIAELGQFAAEGGRTVVDPTCRGIGRDPEALIRIARATGLNIVMGAGYYLEASHPPHLAGLSEEDIAAEIAAEARDGVGDSGARIGLIGEIGVSADFTPTERRVLRGAALAAARTGLPLMVHLPGWERVAHEVLDVVEACGQPLDRVILCHMNPSHDDPLYQRTLARRGAYIEYDMLGMDYWYDDQQVQCPGDADCAAAIARLVADGFGRQVLLSQDVFLKMMLSAHGGNGYAHVQRHVLPRLRRLGLSPADLDMLMIDNPRQALAQRRIEE
ncbi:phosphotriesterase family protein [Limimaricola pyoseonensis]|uniref:Phosphotriesterase-related protein n=1 Tax=Limimaricola pyoseonensis TaxID=521013 RepID=A0A1G7FYD3_9RHOB|nr:phosphotriesterase [Limimaricola pyoseonensis]SDE80877.1 phosphotriesterase-related protein [Limimaricola pyoseonensis]